MNSRTDFNSDWHFAFSDAEWPDDYASESPAAEPVFLPHTWNATDMLPGAENPRVGPGWYSKTFKTPRLEQGQRLLLEFEGATNCHKVWVNGGYAGGRDGGFLSTMMDITDLVGQGENEVLVRVDNSYELRAAMPRHVDWNRYGGVTRPVWLHVRNHAYLGCGGVEIRTPEVGHDSARTVVATHVQETAIEGCALEIRHTLLSPEGELVSATTTPLQTSFARTSTIAIELPVVERPVLWSDVDPRLYALTTEVLRDGRVIDARQDRIGYRFYRFDPDEGFSLNGKPTKLKGANIHIFFPGLGNAVPERFHRSDMQLMKDMGCNYMRTSHYPRPKECLDACDELGIMVLEEHPYWHGSLRAANGEAAIDNATVKIRELVGRHRNHPCIIAWNTVNEVMLAPAYKPGVGHLEPNDPRREAWKINPKEYPYIRRHLQAMVDTFKECDPDRPVSMVVGGGWKKNDEAGLSSIADIVAYNGGALNISAEPFKGELTSKTYEFRPDYYREIYPKRVHMMSEGVLNDVTYERGDWAREDEAWRKSALYWSVFAQRPWFCGGSMWCFTDYSANSMIRLHGAVDRHRLPKDLFRFYEAMWADHPVLHILGHWNHAEGSQRDVTVFSNCSDLRLTLNGRSLGPGTRCGDYPGIDNPPIVWEGVKFEAGTLEVRGTTGSGDHIDTRITAGSPAKITIASSNDLVADGRDISYVDFTVTDEAGNRCYTSDVTLSVEVNGAAAAAISQVEASGGLGRLAIRSTGIPGEAVIVANAPGLQTGKVTVRASRG